MKQFVEMLCNACQKLFALVTINQIRVIRGSTAEAQYYSKSYTTTRVQTRLNTFSTNSICIGWLW
jgi:hypothetical protein